MPHICEICGKGLKSAAGLAGHKQIAHAAIARPDVPDEHVLAEAVESALDIMGELRELLDRQLPQIVVGLNANWDAVGAKLDSFQRSLTPPDGHTPPSLALIGSWEDCSGCAPKWVELKEVLWQRLHEEKLMALRQSLHEEKLAEAKALAEHSGEAESERSEQAELLSQRWLVVLPTYKGGFRWKGRKDGFPGLPASIQCEGYVKVVERDEADTYRGKRGVEVLELMPIDGLADYEESKLRTSAETKAKPKLRMSPGYFSGSKWDEERQLYVEQH